MPAPPATHYLIVAYDAADAPRDVYRDQHLARSAPMVASGRMVVGGPMLSDDGSKMIGSTIILTAEEMTLENVWEYVMSDPYFLNGVWDDVKVHPFFPGAGIGFTSTAKAG